MTKRQRDYFNANRPSTLQVYAQRLRWEAGCTFWFVLRWSLMIWFVKTYLLHGVTFWVAA